MSTDEEVTSREASKTRTRLKQAVFAVVKDLDEVDAVASQLKPATLPCLASLGRITADEGRGNSQVAGPAGGREKCPS
jgi:hypothetical protein